MIAKTTLLVITGAAAFMFGGVSLILGFRVRRFLRTAVRTKGQIVSIHSTDGFKRAPKFEFKDEAGVVHQVSSTFSSNWCRDRVGGTIDIVYPKGRPADAEPLSFGPLWFVTIWFGLIGAVATALTILFLLIH